MIKITRPITDSTPAMPNKNKLKTWLSKISKNIELNIKFKLIAKSIISSDIIIINKLRRKQKIPRNPIKKRKKQKQQKNGTIILLLINDRFHQNNI